MTNYALDIGSTPHGNQYHQSGALGSALSTTAGGLPNDGSLVYVTLYSQINGQWVSLSYTYTTINAAAGKATLTTPPPGSTFTGSSVTFGWTPGRGATAYWLNVGSSAGGHQYYTSGNLGNVLSTTVSTLPTDGSRVYVALYSLASASGTVTPIPTVPSTATSRTFPSSRA